MPLGSNLRGEAKNKKTKRVKYCKYLSVWKVFDFFCTKDLINYHWNQQRSQLHSRLATYVELDILKEDTATHGSMSNGYLFQCLGLDFHSHILYLESDFLAVFQKRWNQEHSNCTFKFSSPKI